TLPQRLPQARHPQSCHLAHGNDNQQRLHQLRHPQGGGESSPIAKEARWHHRPLSGGATRYLGNLCGPPGTSSTHPADGSSQRQTHPWCEARSTPTVSPHALPGALLLPRRRSHLHHSRLVSTNPAGPTHNTRTVQTCRSPLLPLASAC